MTNDDRNWMSSIASGTRGGPAIGQIERPVTASSQGAKVRELQDEIKRE